MTRGIADVADYYNVGGKDGVGLTLVNRRPDDLNLWAQAV